MGNKQSSAGTEIKLMIESEEVDFEYLPEDTLETLKNLVADNYSIAVENQEVFVGDDSIPDGKTLLEFQVQPGDTLYVYDKSKDETRKRGLRKPRKPIPESAKPKATKRKLERKQPTEKKEEPKVEEKKDEKKQDKRGNKKAEKKEEEPEMTKLIIRGPEGAELNVEFSEATTIQEISELVEEEFKIPKKHQEIFYKDTKCTVKQLLSKMGVKESEEIVIKDTRSVAVDLMVEDERVNGYFLKTTKIKKIMEFVEKEYKIPLDCQDVYYNEKFAEEGYSLEKLMVTDGSVINIYDVRIEEQEEKKETEVKGENGEKKEDTPEAPSVDQAKPTIPIAVAEQEPEEEFIKLKLDLAGEIFDVDFELNGTITELKEFVADECNIPIESIIIKYKDAEYNGETTLKEVNIEADDSIIVIDNRKQ